MITEIQISHISFMRDYAVLLSFMKEFLLGMGTSLFLYVDLV